MKKGARTELAVAGGVDEGIGDGLEEAGQELGGLDLVDESDARHGEVCDEGEERREGVMDQSFTVGPHTKKHRKTTDLWLGPESFGFGDALKIIAPKLHAAYLSLPS